MKKQRFRLAALALAALLALGCAGGEQATRQGELKDGMTWSLGNEGVLVITGDGDMPDYGRAEDVPWYSCREQILWIMLDGAITRVGSCAFAGCVNATHITFPDTIRSIGARAFYECTAMASSKCEKVTDDGGGDPLPGDVNRDGSVDGLDVIRLMKWLADEIDESTGAVFDISKTNADVNADGEVDERDLLQLVRLLGGAEADPEKMEE